MSYFACPHCGKETHIFGHGGAQQMAAKMGIDFLGRVPLETQICKSSDDGNPLTYSAPQSHFARVFRDIAQKVLTKVQTAAASAPKISME